MQADLDDGVRVSREVLMIVWLTYGLIPVDFGDSRTVDLYWTHRAEGTEHFHSLRTTRWPVARKNIPIFRPERTHPATCPSISESRRRRTYPSIRIPVPTDVRTIVKSGTNAYYYKCKQTVAVSRVSRHFTKLSSREIVSLFDFI